MGEFEQYESKRVILQNELDSCKTQAERNRLGQFATPFALAKEIVKYTLELIPAGTKIRFLDPGFGTGSFFSGLLSEIPLNRIDTAEGFEIDPHYGNPSALLWKDTPLKLHISDFTKAESPKNKKDLFNITICNPPYVRHHHIPSEEKTRLQHLIQKIAGVRFSGLTGLYCYFLALSHAWMTDSSIACWLIPSEFMDVNYGNAFKKFLLKRVTLIRIHRFSPKDVQFADALVSSAIVWFRNTTPQPDDLVEFTFGGALANPLDSQKIKGSRLMREPKWTRLSKEFERGTIDVPTLGRFFKVKRGIATGANHFFILTKEQIDSFGMSIDCFRPILPSPRHLKEDEILSDSKGNPRTNPKLFLLDCKLPEHAVETRYPALWNYLQSGKADIANRYLCRNRSPWYSQEIRPPSPFICTYMGRGSFSDNRPFRFILNHSLATVANTYLLLYPIPELEYIIQQNPSLIYAIWRALKSLHCAALTGEGRIYGGGLHKIEPNELSKVPANPVNEILGELIQPRPYQQDLFGIDHP